MQKLQSVDEYIASAPKELQSKLKQLRRIIRESVPEAQEKLSYGMPYYGYKGRLVYFGLAKNHIGIYLPPPILDEHQSELKKYYTHQATWRLPFDEELPAALIAKLVRARAKRNEEKG